MEIELAWEEVAKEWEKVLTFYIERARLDGFRRGKAPREMVKRLFLKDIQNEVIEILIPRTVAEALKERNIAPLTNPVVSDIFFREGEPLRFKARVEVLPEFELPEYKKIRVQKKEVKVEPKESEESLEKLRQDSAEYLPVEGRGVVEGDYVLLEWKARDTVTRRMWPTEKILLIAGHPQNEENLNENLTGLRLQETRRFVATYPPDHPQKRFAGRTVENEIKVLSIKEKKVPELSDEWAKDLGAFDNLEALREKVRHELEKSKREIARQEMAEEIVEKILHDLRLDLPESLIEKETESVVRDWLQGRAEISPPELENLRQRARSQAERRIKRSLVLRRIAAKERLEVSEEEVDEEIRTLARRNNVPLAQVVDQINREGRREDLKGSLLLRKAIDFLVENAVS